MTLRYLPEHAESALLALELARKEAAHLGYSHRTLFAQPIDTVWVQQLSQRDDLAEKVEAFVNGYEHPPVHAHVTHTDGRAMVYLNGSVKNTGVPDAVMAQARSWINANQQMVIDEWNTCNPKA